MPTASRTRIASAGVPVLISGGVVWWALATSHWSWWGISTMVPTNPEATSFGDLKAVLATSLCMQQGVDYTNCDPYDRPFTPYVVLPARVFALVGLDLDDAAWVGIGLAVVYVVSIGGLAWLLQRAWLGATPPLVAAQALLGVTAVTAPAMLAIERGQVEIVVLALTVVALALLASRRRTSRIVGAAAAVLAVAGKYFAVGLFAPFVRRRRPSIAVVLALVLSVAFVLLSWSDLQQAVSTSRAAEPATSQSQFGAAALLATALSDTPITGIPSPDVVAHWTTVTWAAWLMVAIAIVAAAVAIPGAASAQLDSSPVARSLLLGGLGVLLLPYVLGASHDYRQVFLLPALVGALAWLSAPGGRGRWVPWALVLTITGSLLTGASMIPTPSGLLGPDEFMWSKPALIVGDACLLVALALGSGLWLHGWRRQADRHAG